MMITIMLKKSTPTAMSLMMAAIISGLLVLQINADAPATCYMGCTNQQSDNRYFHYETGHKYDYQFDSILTISTADVAISNTDDTSLKLTGTAAVYAEGNCVYTLQLSTIRVQEAKTSIEKRIHSTIQKPIQFTLSDGGIAEPHVCADVSDDDFSLNIKRAIISLLQTPIPTKKGGGDGSIPRATEIDIFGKCPTVTTKNSHSDGYEVFIKQRNLKECAYREQLQSGIVRGVVNERTGIKMSDDLEASYVKKTSIDAQTGLVMQVKLVEQYIFVIPATQHTVTTHIRAKVVTNIKNTEITKAAAPAPSAVQHAVSIIFQKSAPYAIKNIGALKEALGALVTSSGDYVQSGSAKKFVEIIRLMRQADMETLLELASAPHQNKVLARRVYLDALFRTGTAESAKAILKQFNKLDDHKQKLLAIISLNLVRSVDRETLQMAVNLLNANAPKEVFLSIGHLVSKYCDRHDYQAVDIEVISKKFIDNLKHCRAQSKQDEDRIIYILKGISNTKHLAKSATNALVECASAAGHSNRIRAAAIQAFSAASCVRSIQRKALDLLKDRNEDAELRIEAYLVAIECPTAEIANEIAEIVNRETVHQVGGFIASSIQVIRDSTDPKRELQRYHLSNIRVTKQFPNDFRRYSYNSEFSYRFDALGLGATIDHRLIYSQQGFLPRSARLNVTTEIYGVDYNVFEANWRQENLEKVLEYYFGPKGLINMELDEIIKIVSNNEGVGGRSRRSIASDALKFGKKYKTYGNSKAMPYDINLDLSLKLFGSELLFLSLGDIVPASLPELFQIIAQSYNMGKERLSDFHKEFTQHALFSDSEKVYTTGLGIPLELQSQGFAANKLDFGVGIDLDAFPDNWHKSKYRLKLVPSCDINYEIRLGFNAYVLSDGIRFGSQLHSASGVNIVLNFENDGELFNLDMKLPREKIELVAINYQIDFYVAEQDKPIHIIPINSDDQNQANPLEPICFNQLSSIGVNVCYTVKTNPLSAVEVKSSHAPNTLSSIGSGGIAIYMLAERHIRLRGSHSRQNSRGAQEWQLHCTTPGAKDAHNTTATFELGAQDRIYSRVSYETAQQHWSFEFGLNNDESEIVLYKEVQTNTGELLKRSRVGFLKSGSEYRPVIEMQQPNGGIANQLFGFKAGGRIVIEESSAEAKRYIFDNFEIINPQNVPFTLNGLSEINKNAITSDLQLSIDRITYVIQLNGKFSDDGVALGYFIHQQDQPEYIYGISVALQYGQDYGKLEVITKALGWEFNTHSNLHWISFETQQNIGTFDWQSDVLVKHKQSIVLNGKVILRTTDQQFHFETELLRQKHVASLLITLTGDSSSRTAFDLTLNAKLNKHFAEFHTKFDIQQNRELLDSSFKTSSGTLITFKGDAPLKTFSDIISDSSSGIGVSGADTTGNGAIGPINLQGIAQFSSKDKPYEWSLKLNDIDTASNKPIVDFHLQYGNADHIILITTAQSQQEKELIFKTDLQVKNVLKANAELKLDKNGNGELVGTVEIQQKTDVATHKLDVSSKFHMQNTKFDVDLTVVLDSTKRFYYKTDNVFDKMKYTTKNILDIGGMKRTFDAKADLATNGDYIINFAISCASGRKFDGTLKQKTQSDHYDFVLKLHDQFLVGSKKRSLDITVISEGPENNENLKYQLLYSNFEQKRLDISGTLKVGGNETIEGTIAANGEFLPQPIELALYLKNTDELESVLAYGFTGKYGTSFSASINGELDGGDYVASKPLQYTLKASLQAPHTSFKSIDIESNGKILRPPTEEKLSQSTTLSAKSHDQHIFDLHLSERSGSGQFLRFNLLLESAIGYFTYATEMQASSMPSLLKLEGSYQQQLTKAASSKSLQKYNFNAEYAGKYVRQTGELRYEGNDSATLAYHFDSNFEQISKNVDFELRIRNIDKNDSYDIQLIRKESGKTYAINSKLYRSAHKKGLELKAQDDGVETISIIGFYERLGEHKAKLTLKIANLAKLDLQGIAETEFTSLDDFYINAKLDSDSLKLHQYNFSAKSENKMVYISLKSVDQGDIFNGSANYALKREQNKEIVEGQGQLQYRGQGQNINFRLIRQLYMLGQDKEVGFSYSFNGNFGPKNGVATLKITNKDFNVKLSVCEEKKQCTNIQYQSIVSVDEEKHSAVQHSLLILVDLREMGYPYEFAYQSKTVRQGLKFQYSIDSSIISNNNLKYQIMLNVLPTNSLLQVKLPTREIALESLTKYPDHGIAGYYENSLSFYVDKTRRPNEVTRLICKADVNSRGSGDQYQFDAATELIFEHPTIRPLAIRGKSSFDRTTKTIYNEIILDIFRTAEQQIISKLRSVNNVPSSPGAFNFNITALYALSSQGLGFHHELNWHGAFDEHQQQITANIGLHSDLQPKFNILFSVAPSSYYFITHLLDEEIYSAHGKRTIGKLYSSYDSAIRIYGGVPVEVSSEFQPSHLRLSIKRANLIDANLEVRVGKEIVINSVAADGKPIFDGRVQLDSKHFLNTNYQNNKDAIQAYLDNVDHELRKETAAAQANIKQRFTEIRQKLQRHVELAKQSTPDLSPLKAIYEENANDIVKELENDPALKQIAATYHELYSKIAQLVSKLSKTWVESYEKLHKSTVELYENITTIFNENILPILEEFAQKFTYSMGALRVEIINLETKAFDLLMQILEKYGPAIKSYGNAIYETLRPMHEASEELIKLMLNIVDELINEWKEYVTQLPTFDELGNELKKQLTKLKLADSMVKFIDHLYKQLKALPLTEATIQFLDKSYVYIMAKIQSQPLTNETQMIEEILRLFVKALRSLVIQLELATGADNDRGDVKSMLYGASKYSLTNAAAIGDVQAIGDIRALLTLRSSIINYILNENWSEISSLSHLRLWWFFSEFDLHGQLIDGQRVITFDRQYYQLPTQTSCKYVLAQDSVDNNFTVIATINNGKLKAIALTDRDGQFLELTDNGVLKVNGKPTEYPQHLDGGSLHAWRLYHTTHVLSDYGIEVVCTPDLRICHIGVNGFYTSKTRGLLGNGNAEPYDDYKLVDGAIGSDYAALVNGYGLGKCHQIVYDEGVMAQSKTAEICHDLFGFESTLSSGYIVQNPKAYRELCDVAVAANSVEKDSESIACNIATAYGLALRQHGLVAMLPLRCLKCTGAAGQRELFQKFTMKIPNQKADLVFVIDVAISPIVLNTLIAPAIGDIRDALKQRGFTDVQIGVIAFNQTQKYPALITSDSGKINYQGNLGTLKLNGPNTYCLRCDALQQQPVLLDERLERIYNITDELIRAIIPQSDEKAFDLALKYPFRAGAAKSIIGVRSDALRSENQFKTIRAHITDLLTDFDGALLHVIGPVDNLKLEGIPEEKLVGFNQRLVATLDGKDAKKRAKLEYDEDLGVEFVLENGGWVFNTAHYDDMKAQDQKKVLSQVVVSVADTLFKTEIVSECSCKPSEGLFAQHKCTISSSYFVPNKKVKNSAAS